jgi:MarR family transcriptional regulator, organic hydroperoxide resistance regulator
MIVDVMRSIEPADKDAPRVAMPLDGPALESDPTGRIIADYRATIVAMKCAMSDRLVRLGISMAQLNILHTLQRTGEMPMSRLADVLNVSVSNATGLVDRMEERGLIARHRVPEDRRIVLVRITDGGVRILEENDAQTDGLMREVLADLDPTQLQVIARAVAQFRASLETAVDVHTRDRHPIATPDPRSR